jgi:prepilin-type N-terminal cleavage/methylation domain-containing protein
MTRPARTGREGGFTLIELVITMTIMLVVLGATLTTFNVFERNAKRNEQQNAAQDLARAGIDRIARDLRNHATPTNELPIAIEKADGNDVEMLTVGAHQAAASTNTRNLERVRYCLNPADRTIWRQRQSYTGEPPATPPAMSQCPGAGWAQTTAVAEGVVNNAGRAVFCFPPTPCGSAPASTTTITSVGITLFVDVSDAPPKETKLSTVVALRNQNRHPTAHFEATALGARHVLLVASASEDPEGQALTYRWFDGGVAIDKCVGMVCEYRAPLAGSRSFTLKVSDPSDLEATDGPKTVVVR